MFTIPQVSSMDPHTTQKLIEKLNQGPDFSEIVHPDHKGRLPDNWRLSYGNIAITPAFADVRRLTQLATHDFELFESACQELLAGTNSEGHFARFVVSQGVETTSNEVRAAYLNSQSTFSVRRLDLILGEEKVVCGESDEQPGGFARACLLDWAYGINQGRWLQAFKDLTSDGLLVFIVSSHWSSVYITETRWLVSHMQQLGFEAEIILTDEPNSIKLRDDGLHLKDGRKIAAVWRLFPIFEVEKKWFTVVKEALAGRVRLIPEFASYGNKAWIGLFHSNGQAFRSLMGNEAYDRLAQSLPHTMLFPDLNVLKNVPPEVRNELIVKVVGANKYSTRSYGVAIGTTLTANAWRETLDELTNGGRLPIVAQRFYRPKAIEHSAASMLDGDESTFKKMLFYMLARPWSVYGKLVSCILFASPADSYFLHGKVSNSEIPVDLDSSADSVF